MAAINPGPIQQKPTQAQQDATTTQNATGGIYKVGDNGQAPKGLKAGDQVVTGGGTYTINSVNADGSYSSSLTNKDQTTGNYAGSYSSLPVATASKNYNAQTDYQALIEQALAAGDNGAAAYYEDQRNKKIAGEGDMKHAPTNYYSQYLGQVTPARAAQLENGYVARTMEERLADKPLSQIRAEELTNQWAAAAGQQAEAKIDYGVKRGVNELQRAQEDAQPQFQQQRNQTDIDAARAKDNSALYSEVRGDKGGIGKAQYDAIQAAALKNHQTINAAQTKLATDTARQIADLRAQGEFDKADALLQIAQQQLQQMISLEQWGATYTMSRVELEEELRRAEQNYQIQRAQLTGVFEGNPTFSAAQYQEGKASDVAKMLLSAGIVPSDSQLAAMGMTADQARQLAQIYAAQRSFSSGGSGGGRGRGSGGGGGGDDDDEGATPTTYTPTGAGKNTAKDSAAYRLTGGAKDTSYLSEYQTLASAERYWSSLESMSNGGSSTASMLATVKGWEAQGKIDQRTAAEMITSYNLNRSSGNSKSGNSSGSKKKGSQDKMTDGRSKK